MSFIEFDFYLYHNVMYKINIRQQKFRMCACTFGFKKKDTKHRAKMQE